jgi:predicted PurR-regulated permease PerM
MATSDISKPESVTSAPPDSATAHASAASAIAPVEPPPSATFYEKSAWILVAIGLFLILHLHVLSSLMAGLFVHSLIHGLAEQIHGKRLTHERAKVVALLIVGSLIIALATTVVVILLLFLKPDHISELFRKLAESLDAARHWVKDLNAVIPELDADGVRAWLAAWLHEHSEEVKKYTSEFGHLLLHAVIGIVVGALLAFETHPPRGPLSAAIFERARRLSAAFEAVVFAQIKISALNTGLTAAYLFVVLPACGVHLGLRKTLVAATFICGLMPVVGNLVSNSVIVILSMGIRPEVALGSLLFLVLIHKLEYFVNAKIMGTQIHAAAWEMLVVIFAFEAAFGVPGVIAAPIFYAYVKKELEDRKLI